MGDLFNNLPYKNELNTWIHEYAGYERVSKENPASLNYLMRLWEEAKGKYLYKLLGDSFIVEKDIFIEKNSNDFYDAVDDSWETPAFQDFLTNYTNWLEEFKKDGLKKLDEDQCYFVVRNLRSLINRFSLKENCYRGDTIHINVNEKSITLQYGSKVSRILNKIATAAGIEGYEAFRIAYSRIFNDKKIKGTLCLSIHPLDYMTMSDNEYDWDSCMSWRNGGCYRMGTVEMMNSPCVLVAYLKGDKKMRFFGNYWNSKKWRNLFIVTPEIITGIKGYPYQKTELDEIVIKTIKDLADKNLNWSYNDHIHEYSFSYNDEKVWLDDENYLYMNFETGYMYNDFGNSNTTHFILAPDVGSIYCNYSGSAECMYCGSIIGTEASIDEADTLVCDDCFQCYYCASCDIQLSEDECYELDGEYYCESCYYDNREYDIIDDDFHNRNNMTQVYIIDSLKDAEEFFADKEKIDEKRENLPFIYLYDIYNATRLGLTVQRFDYSRKTDFGWEYNDTIFYVVKENIPGRFVKLINDYQQCY